MSLYSTINTKRASGKKLMAVLIDPDGIKRQDIQYTVDCAMKSDVDVFLIGGSLILDDRLDATIREIKTKCNIPIVLFPGNTMQINKHADAILFLSMISSRNPELLIGKHVESAPYLKKAGLEVISTGYMLIDGGQPTSVAYMSQSMPIPSDKNEIAIATALAGEMLGMKTLYMDAGSGAEQPIRPKMISAVRKHTTIPLIVGGGIRSGEVAYSMLEAGADMLVVGNAFESNPELMFDISAAVRQAKTSPIT